ncbi:MAG: FAD-dependent oxidoreductase [Candidatus Moranbacteria bacterium]|nr:FAD-dependent oxidoreductase [Candidatus Moranbacteria bacterium]
MEYILTLKRFEEVADGTRLFIFAKPDDFTFQAGQYVALRIEASRLVSPDERGGIRSFSIASAPYEDELHFVMREGITGFKKTMWDLKPGDAIGSTKAVGHCTIPENDGKAIVLLAGGVGIAPVRAMIRDAVRNADGRGYYLFYSNRELKDAAFHDDLKSVLLPDFHYVWTLSDATDPATESCEERGYITADMIRKHLPDTVNCHYYVIGAPAFADAMKALLLGMGIPEAEIKIDPFTGLTGPVVTGNK